MVYAPLLLVLVAARMGPGAARDSGYSAAVNFGLRDASAREALKRLVD
jgi:hypothetical protein